MFVLLLTGFVSVSSAKNLYRNEEYKFSITFPEGWKAGRGSGSDTVVIASDITGSKITIEMVVNDTNHTVDTLSKEMIAVFLDGYKTIVTDMEISDQSETRIGNRKALMAKFNGTIKNIKTSSHTTTLTYFTIYNDYAFIITCTTDLSLYKNYNKMFMDSVSTLVFEDYIIDRSPVGTTKNSQVDHEDMEGDKYITSMIVGKWEETINFGSYTRKDVSTYYQDMHFEKEITFTANQVVSLYTAKEWSDSIPSIHMDKGDELHDQISGRWSVLAGQLNYQIIRTSNSLLLPREQIISVSVLSIGEKKAILQLENKQGFSSYRVPSNIVDDSRWQEDLKAEGP